MRLREFEEGVRSGLRRVQLPQAEDGGPKERGFLANPIEALADPQGGEGEEAMVIVVVDREFLTDRTDDGLRELSISQIEGFLEGEVES